MAFITVTDILGTDSVSGSRLTINSNAHVLRDAINVIEQHLDTDTETLAIKAANITDSARPVTDIVLNVLNSASIGGNLAVVGTITVGGIVSANANVTVQNGNFEVTDATSNTVIKVDKTTKMFEVHGGEKWLFPTAFVADTFYNLTPNSCTFDCAKKRICLMKFDNSASNGVHTISSLANPVTGQRVLFLLADNTTNSGGKNFISGSLFENVTGNIEFSKVGQYIEGFFDGTKWYITNIHPGVTAVLA